MITTLTVPSDSPSISLCKQPNIDFQSICVQLDAEEILYRQAINEGREFTHVKEIYLRIKQLKCLIEVIGQNFLK